VFCEKGADVVPLIHIFNKYHMTVYLAADWPATPIDNRAISTQTWFGTAENSKVLKRTERTSASRDR